MKNIEFDKDLEVLSSVLDNKFVGPMGIRFGLDGIIGLVPIVGDLMTGSMSGYIVFRCALKRYPKTVIIRMVINILIETVVGLIPIVGNLFDIYWKANLKNISLAKQYEQNSIKVHNESRLAVSFYLMTLLALMSLIVVMPFVLLFYAMKLF